MGIFSREVPHLKRTHERKFRSIPPDLASRDGHQPEPAPHMNPYEEISTQLRTLWVLFSWQQWIHFSFSLKWGQRAKKKRRRRKLIKEIHSAMHLHKLICPPLHKTRGEEQEINHPARCSCPRLRCVNVKGCRSFQWHSWTSIVPHDPDPLIPRHRGGRGTFSEQC